jgi:hypothetical protein
MSDLPAYRRAARTVACSHCGAPVGRPCRLPSGWVTFEHRNRYSIVGLAQNIGYEEGLRDALDLIDWQVGRHGVNTTIQEVRHQIERQHEMVARSVRREEEAGR